VWTTTIAKQIHYVLHEAGVLHVAQGGNKLNEETMNDVSLQVINQIVRMSNTFDKS
jgi:hypothetical protein